MGGVPRQNAPMTEQPYVYGGVRALVELHDKHLRSFVGTWKRASAEGLRLPPTKDQHCATLDAMLRHVLGAARHYLVWVCEQAGLEDPGVAPTPDDVAASPDAYVEHLLGCWDRPLRGLDEKTTDQGEYASAWGTRYCIDGMLEHAVMHPIRHEHQLTRAQAPA